MKDKKIYEEIEILCNAWEKAADPEFLTEWYDSRENFIKFIKSSYDNNN